jgi:hypothetical protein
VVLDFNGVAGLDGTAARTCFAALFRTLSSYDIKMVLTRVNPEIKALLVANGLVEAADTRDEPERGGTFDPSFQHRTRGLCRTWGLSSQCLPSPKLCSTFLDARRYILALLSLWPRFLPGSETL